VTSEVVESWAATLRTAYSPTRYNGTLGTLQAVFEMCVEKGLLLDNPARKVQPVSVPIEPPAMLTQADLDRLLAELDSNPRRRDAATLVRFLCHTGARVGSASRVTASCVSFDRNEIVLPKLKYDDVSVRVPIMAKLKPLLKQLVAKSQAGKPLFRKSAKTALRTCAAKLNIPVPTHHSLRHLFCTRCMESGVDVKTIASWLGHKDGGALLLRRYAHLMDEHSQLMSRRVRF
jgi:integrase